MTTIFSIGSIPAFTPGSGIGPGDGQIDAQIIFLDVFYVEPPVVDPVITEVNGE